MNKLIIGLIGIFSFVVTQEVPDLCKNPNIHAADRLTNNTYRVYRDYYYWELVGLPDRRVKVNGPFKVWYQYMAPLDRATSVQTTIEGNANGITYKFRGKKFWMYRSNGELMQGGKPGFDNPLIPSAGFNAVLNDGKMGGKGYPIMIGFSGITVYYYNAGDRIFRQIGKSEGYTGGMNNENFPGDLTAAFAFPSSEPEVKYFVYLFKNNKYCYRPVIADEECKEWRDNTELFNCSSGIVPNTNSPDKEPEPTGLEPDTNQIPTEVEPGANLNDKSERDVDSSEGSGGIFMFLVLMIIAVIIVVTIVVGIVVFAMRGKPQSNEKKKGTNKPKAQPLKTSQSKVSSKSGKKVASKA